MILFIETEDGALINAAHIVAIYPNGSIVTTEATELYARAGTEGRGVEWLYRLMGALARMLGTWAEQDRNGVITFGKVLEAARRREL